MNEALPVRRGQRVAVLGGGVVGLSAARELAGRGLSVVLLEAREIGAGASLASVGVLSAPTPKRSALARLARAAYEMYPELARELREETGVDIGYSECGSVTLLEGRARRPDRQLAFWKGAGVEGRWVGRDFLDRAIPGYGGRAREGLWLDREAVVSPGALIDALRISCESRGVELREHVGELRLEAESGSGTLSVRVGAPDGGADPGLFTGFDEAAVVLAAGAWSTRAASGIPEPRVAVEPVRGQALELRRPPPLSIVHFRRPGHRKPYYLVPRPGHRIWVGSTVEDVGFDDGATQEGRDELLAAAREVLPDVRESEIERIWSGLRPRAARRGGPFLGPWPGFANLWMACGHYRSGVLMGPLSARRLADCMVEGRPPEKDFSLSGDDRGT